MGDVRWVRSSVCHPWLCWNIQFPRVPVARFEEFSSFDQTSRQQESSLLLPIINELWNTNVESWVLTTVQWTLLYGYWIPPANSQNERKRKHPKNHWLHNDCQQSISNVMLHHRLKLRYLCQHPLQSENRCSYQRGLSYCNKITTLLIMFNYRSEW